MFSLFLNKAKTFRNSLFLLRIARQTGPDSLFSFSVSKKVSKSAVVRNKMRRSGYRSIEKFMSKIGSGNLLNFVFKKVPQNDNEVAEKIKDLLIESKLMIF